MKKILLVALILFSTTLSAQGTRVPIGTSPTLAWTHDGVNVTHFRIYQAPFDKPAARVKIGPDIPVAMVAGAQEAIFPIKFTTAGRYVLFVSAVNLGIGEATPSAEIFSSALPIEVILPIMPPPTAPTGFRIVGAVASNGSLNFVLEASVINSEGIVVWSPYIK